MSAPRAGDKCCIHMLHFAKIDEFPGEDPDLEELLSEFAAHKCQRNGSKPSRGRESRGREVQSGAKSA